MVNYLTLYTVTYPTRLLPSSLLNYLQLLQGNTETKVCLKKHYTSQLIFSDFTIQQDSAILLHSNTNFGGKLTICCHNYHSPQSEQVHPQTNSGVH